MSGIENKIKKIFNFYLFNIELISFICPQKNIMNIKKIKVFNDIVIFFC